VAEGGVRVLVACEYSGTVRDAFIRAGHDAMSCDLLPSDAPGPHHQGDVIPLLTQGWDLMVAFPPCTFLCSSGLHWNKRVPGRADQTEQALEFVRTLLDAPIPRIALENPIGCISTRIRKPDQIIHPHQFGHPESKTTCLWLKGLPKLEATNRLALPASGRWENMTPSGQNKLGPSADRWKIRSKTYQGIADAMASQWGTLRKNPLASLPVGHQIDWTLDIKLAAECPACECCGEPWCPDHKQHYSDCPCPGPHSEREEEVA
jgi:hypothetical protein